MINVLRFAVVRSLAVAVLANALKDLIKGRDTAEILSWIERRPAALPFWMASVARYQPRLRVSGFRRWLPTLLSTESPCGLWRTASLVFASIVPKPY